MNNSPRFQFCPFCRATLMRDSISETQARGYHGWRLQSPKTRIHCNDCWPNNFIHLYDPNSNEIHYSRVLIKELEMCLEIFYQDNLLRLYKIKFTDEKTFVWLLPQIVELNDIMNIDFTDKNNIVRKFKTLVTFS